MPEHDEWGDWDKAVQLGRDYMVGSRVPMGKFLCSHRSRLNAWQQVASVWAQQHPDKLLVLDSRRRTWHVYKRGQYVSFRLPFHDAGGERTYISRDGHHKIHVDTAVSSCPKCLLHTAPVGLDHLLTTC